jgi:hypothetical protein
MQVVALFFVGILPVVLVLLKYHAAKLTEQTGDGEK